MQSPLLAFMSEFQEKDTLYHEHQHTCLALLRLLPPLCKQFVLRLLFASEQPTHKMKLWLKPEAPISHFQTTMATLSSQLGLLAVDQKAHGCLVPSFSLALKQGLGRAPEPASPAIDVSTSGYEERWESVLLSVGGGAQSVLPGRLLQAAGLCTDAGHVTNAGFQFLLLGTHSQLWMLLIGHLRDERESLTGDWIDALLYLSLRAPGNVSNKRLPEGMLSLLSTLGVLLDLGEGAWACTPLASALSSQSEEAEVRGWIIVENSFRVYAYTQSALHIQILGMFMSLETRLPNLVVASLRRATVRRALQRGITAAQILSFLRKNAHPSMRADSPVLPDVVTDQVRAWAREDDRVFSEGDGALLADFPNTQIFEQAKRVCQERGVLLWSKEGALFVENDAVNEIIETISKWRI